MIITTLFININMSIHRMLKYILVSPQHIIIYSSSKEPGSSVHTHIKRFLKNQVAGFMYMLYHVFFVKMKEKTHLCIHTFYRHKKYLEGHETTIYLQWIALGYKLRGGDHEDRFSFFNV